MYQKFKKYLSSKLFNTILCLATSFIGVLVFISWYLDARFILNILPGAVSMKALTAFNLALSGTIPLFLKRGNGIKDVIVPMLCVFIIFSSVVSLGLGRADMFFEFEQGDATFTPYAGVPSIMTLVSFILVGASGIFSLVNGGKLARIVGNVLVGIGAICTFGYLIREPILFFYIEGVSTAMAIHTGLCFAMLGWALSHQSHYRLSSENNKACC